VSLNGDEPRFSNIRKRLTMQLPWRYTVIVDTNFWLNLAASWLRASYPKRRYSSFELRRYFVKLQLRLYISIWYCIHSTVKQTCLHITQDYEILTDNFNVTIRIIMLCILMTRKMWLYSIHAFLILWVIHCWNLSNSSPTGKDFIALGAWYFKTCLFNFKSETTINSLDSSKMYFTEFKGQ